jgi:hypothetical protein
LSVGFEDDEGKNGSSGALDSREKSMRLFEEKKKIRDLPESMTIFGI